jgi:outer membrane lipoprotein-sorting protein
MRRTVWVVFSLLLALSLALAGCGQKITAEEIVARVRETVETTEDAHAVISADLDAQGIQMSVTAEVWEKAPNKVRIEVLEASQPDLVGMAVVSDGEQGWAYNPERNRVMVGPVADIETPIPQEMLVELQEMIQRVLDASNVELVGEETLGDRDTYKLALSPREDEPQPLFPGGGTATLWVDKEQWFVLKATYEGGTFGQGTMQVRQFELNAGLADDLFHFDIPEGAEITDVEAQQPVPLSLDEARAQASFPLLVPGYVPEDATLVEVFRVGGSFVLRYDHSPQVSFAIVQGDEIDDLLPLGEMSPDAAPYATVAGTMQDVEVRGYQGMAITTGTEGEEGNTLLSWTENGVTVTVGGRISLDEALKVAESLQ